MKNHNENIKWFCNPYLELFKDDSWAYEKSVGIILAYEAEIFTLFFEKRHIFKAIGEAIMRGRMEGGFRHTRWCAGGVLYTHMEHFSPPKRDFFYLDVCLSMKRRRPP